MNRALWILVAIFAIPLFSGLLTERIPPSKVGIRRNLWGGGIESRDFETGFHLGVVGTTLGLIEARRQERIAVEEA